MQEAVVVEAIRTPMGRRRGSLAQFRPDDLAGYTIKALVDRVGIDPLEIEDIIMGCVTQIGEQGLNVGRVGGLIAGLPPDVSAVSINRMCGSSLQAVNFAAQAIMSGMSDVVMAAGVESMTRVPMGSDGGTMSSQLTSRYSIIPQGLSAEMIAEKWQIPREELDEFSFESHMKAVRAREEGRFKREIVPVEVSYNGITMIFGEDETPRADTSREKMAALAPAFKPDGVITAGNSSQITDGAAACLIMSREKARSLGLKARARIIATAVAGVDPVIMLTGPIPVTGKVLRKANLSLEDMDIFEVNEAFAPVVLAWQRELGANMSKVNPNGGAISLGHPLGASGCRIMATMLHELERTGGRYGLATMCIGFGMGVATIIERLDD